MTHASAFIQIIVIVCVLVAAWYVVERFSPDPLITKLCQIAIFLIALIIVVLKLLPMIGIA